MVLSVDEKSQIQALDLTQPGLPLKQGRCGTMTHDYKRNGTTTLFAALNVLDGRVIGRCMQRHRHQEFIRFLNAVEAEVPAGKLIHAIVDNYAAHKHPKVRAWLARHPRWTFHFTPTSASWLNAVEGFFAKLSKRRLKRVFHSLVSLQAAINSFLDDANSEPKPFRWIKDPDTIIAAVRRGHQALDFDPLGALGRCRGSATIAVSEEFSRQVGLVCILAWGVCGREQQIEQLVPQVVVQEACRAGTAGRSQRRRRRVLGGERAGAAAPRERCAGRRGAVPRRRPPKEAGRERRSPACWVPRAVALVSAPSLGNPVHVPSCKLPRRKQNHPFLPHLRRFRP